MEKMLLPRIASIGQNITDEGKEYTITHEFVQGADARKSNCTAFFWNGNKLMGCVEIND